VCRVKLVVYYNDVKKDKAALVELINGCIDPTNADAAKIKEILSRKPAPKRQRLTKNGA
jgi:hypothetical protein